MSDFKMKAVETFVNSLKQKQTDITELELECYKFAFLTGFNVGIADDKGKAIQDIALWKLSL